MRRKKEFGFIHRVRLHAARQIAFDLLRLCVPRTAASQPGPIKKAVLHTRVWVCHFILR